jgi:hypothetical protein
MRIMFWVGQRSKKRMEGPAIAQDVEFLPHATHDHINVNALSVGDDSVGPTCYSGTISDADSATHEHDTFDGVQEVRVQATKSATFVKGPDATMVTVLRRTSPSPVTVTRRAGHFLPGSNDRGGDGFDGGTTLVDTLPHRIRVCGRESLHAAEPIWTVDLRIVPRRPHERRGTP